MPAQVFGDIAASLQPKERIPSIAFLSLATRACIGQSYRSAAEMLNLFFHRDGQNSVKLRTLSDMIGRTGNRVSQKLAATTEKILNMHGFDRETGLPVESVELSGNITGPHNPGEATSGGHMLQDAISQINASREEKIPFDAEGLDIEPEAAGCVYVSVDDIGVKRQKGTRRPDFVKETKYIQNTVAHIQHGQESYVLTAAGMQEAMKSVLAFLLFNGLLGNRLVFLTDGARNIKNSIEELFAFRPYTIILDWYHLKKKSQELLSMAIKGKDERNRVLEKLLRVLWAGDVDGAVGYLESLPSSMIKNQKWLEEQCHYLERKKDSITCYAVRAHLGLRNSSNPVEKENDLLVAQRQKHNGMSWSGYGSNSLAALEMVFQNGYENLWFHHGKICFEMPDAEAALDKCA